MMTDHHYSGDWVGPVLASPSSSLAPAGMFYKYTINGPTLLRLSFPILPYIHTRNIYLFIFLLWHMNRRGERIVYQFEYPLAPHFLGARGGLR